MLSPAPADTTSELLLVEKVLALGLDCPPFAVLAFIPISFHTKGKALPVSFLGRRRRRSDTPNNPCWFWVLILLQRHPLPGARLQRASRRSLPPFQISFARGYDSLSLQQQQKST